MVTPNTGLAFGANKGFQVTKREKVVRPSLKKGALGKRVKFVRDVVREVSGFAPYEHRIMEMLKVGKDKRALRLAKRKLGTHKRGKNKREELTGVLAAMRKAQASAPKKK
eukprot:Colp12_sorted_trinity150504_noHs@17508